MPEDNPITQSRWAIISFTATRPYYCVAQCACGTKREVFYLNIRSGKSRSCGCSRRKGRSKTRWSPLKKYGPEYHVWRGMISRCEDKNSTSYPNYGKRGIKVCTEWHNYKAFIKSMGNRPSPQHTLDRIDNNGDYEPFNCKWSTWSEQNRNSRRNRAVTINGITRCLTEWAAISGLSRYALNHRLDRGWSIDETILKPQRRYNREQKATITTSANDVQLQSAE